MPKAIIVQLSSKWSCYLRFSDWSNSHKTFICLNMFVTEAKGASSFSATDKFPLKRGKYRKKYCTLQVPCFYDTLVFPGPGNFTIKTRLLSTQGSTSTFTGCGTHTASYPIVNGRSFRMGKRPEREADHSHLVLRLRMRGAIPHFPIRLHVVLLN